jgi:hypothetical protein
MQLDHRYLPGVFFFLPRRNPLMFEIWRITGCKPGSGIELSWVTSHSSVHRSIGSDNKPVHRDFK